MKVTTRGIITVIEVEKRRLASQVFQCWRCRAEWFLEPGDTYQTESMTSDYQRIHCQCPECGLTASAAFKYLHK